MAAQRAGLAVGVGQGRDGDHFVVRSRHPLRGTHLVVARGGHHRDAALDHAADGEVQDVPLGRAAIGVVVAALGDAHVRRLDQRSGGVGRVALREDPVEAAHVPREQAVTVVVEDLDRPQARARGDADDADRVVLGGDRPGHVRPVVLDVAPCRAVRGRAVVAADHVEVRVVRLDARVHDRHVRVDTLVDAVDLRDGVALGEDPRRRRSAWSDPRPG